jgi:tryptophanyl-tRNA synthetase
VKSIFSYSVPLTETIAPAKRVMSLQDPASKMSKSSANPKSRILITDEPGDINRKVKAALTDMVDGISFDPIARPGVSNLLQLWAHFDRKQRSPQELATSHANLSFRDFKSKVADAIIEGVDGIRKRYYEVLNQDNGQYLDMVASKGAEKARANAEETMVLVREAVGF